MAGEEAKLCSDGERVRVGLVARPGIGRHALEQQLGSTECLELVGIYDTPAVALRYSPPDVWVCDDVLGSKELGKASDPRPVVHFAYGTNQPDRRSLIPLPHDQLGLAMGLEQLKRHAFKAGMATRGARHAVDSRPLSIAPAGGVVDGSGLVVVIGASTGGPAMLQRVIAELPADSPPIVIIQHIGSAHEASLLRLLGRTAALRVVAAKHGAELKSGFVYVGAGEEHVEITKRGTTMRLKCYSGPKINGHRPSIDRLFSSAARASSSAAVGVLMTGMGEDGAAGLLEMRLAGGSTLAQDEATSLVWGMPKAAVKKGAAQRQVPLHRIAKAIVAACGHYMNRRKTG